MIIYNNNESIGFRTLDFGTEYHISYWTYSGGFTSDYSKPFTHDKEDVDSIFNNIKR